MILITVKSESESHSVVSDSATTWTIQSMEFYIFSVHLIFLFCFENPHSGLFCHTLVFVIRVRVEEDALEWH